MKFLRKMLDSLEPNFNKGGKLSFFKPVFDATDSFFFSVDKITLRAPFVRDYLDLKRILTLVVLAVIPATIFGTYNVGFQAINAILAGGAPLDNWQTALYLALGFEFSKNILSYFMFGVLYVLPIILTSYAVGAFWELLFECVRKEDVKESFFVTGFLFAISLPPTTPLWVVAAGISFGIVFGKMVFGGTGYNIVNPALAGRAFLFFAYSTYMSNSSVWIAANVKSLDALTTATPLAMAGQNITEAVNSSNIMFNSFIGLIPGSIGETSFLFLLLGALVLLVLKIASIHIVASVALGTIVVSTLFNLFGAEGNVFMSMPFYMHMFTGAWALGAFFMATDPVTAPQGNGGKWVYGFLIGALIVIIRVLNPSFPEGVMLAILLMNVFAPLIDWFAIQLIIKKRRARYGK